MWPRLSSAQTRPSTCAPVTALAGEMLTQILYELIGAATRRRRILLLRAALLALAPMTLGACSDGEPLVTSEAPLVPIDPLSPPDSIPAPPDPIVPPPPAPDSVLPPPNPDSVTVPPPDSTGVPIQPPPSGPPPEHVGIAFGPYHLPAGLFGGEHSATLRSANILDLLVDLEAARRAGARVILSFVGNERRYRDDNNHFSMAKWKGRVDRFGGFDISSYIQDGTVIGHYILDEPHDPSNWGGTVVTRAQVDEMAKYSKEIWPGLPTIIRGWPEFLKGYQYQYLDAAWAQYSDRFGDVDTFIASNVRDARAAGLSLVVGLNLLGGGNKNGGLRGFSGTRYAMTAAQVRQWGGALMADPYSCAFINWEYNDAYFSRSDIKAALEELSDQARMRPPKSCSK